ncbi:hypothetical protein ACLBW0_24845, partial [Enterobacteriaceae bacterium C34A]
WKNAEDGTARTFTLPDSYAGHSVRVVVTPKGSLQAVTGAEMFSVPVNIEQILDDRLILVTYQRPSYSYAVGNLMATDFEVDSKHGEQFVSNVPICIQYNLNLGQYYAGNTGNDGKLSDTITFDIDPLGIYKLTQVRYAYCKDKNPNNADFSKTPWIYVYYAR